MTLAQFEALVDTELDYQHESNVRLLAVLREYDAQQTGATSGVDLILAKQRAPVRRSSSRQRRAVAA